MFEKLYVSHSCGGKEWISQNKFYSIAFSLIKCIVAEN